MGSFGLSDEQKLKYEKDGYLVIKDVFDATKLRQISEAVDEFVQRSTTITTPDENFKLEWKDQSSKPFLKRVNLPSKHHPVFREIYHHDKLLDVVSDLIGPSIRYIQHDCVFMDTPEVSNCPIKWHQDWVFWPHTNQSLVAGFLSIDDSCRENGCLQIIPGSHKGPFYNHFVEDKFASEITDVTFDPSLAVHVEVPAGGISLHHPFTVHGSAANQSNLPRRHLVFFFGATDAWPLMGVVGKERELWGPVDWDRYCSTVVRGKASKFPRMEALPVSLPVPFTPGIMNAFYSDQSKSIHGNPNY